MTVKLLKRNEISGAARGDFSAYRVLILEPTVGTGRLLLDMLAQDLKVAAVKRVATLTEAVRTLSAGEHNVLISDWSRQTDAIKLLTALRGEKSFNRYLPVVIVTSNSGARNMRMIRDAGADEVVPKPFTQRILRSRLKAVGLTNRPFLEVGRYFGPDRRRFRKPFEGADQRQHSNCNNPDRRRQSVPISAPERRQGLPGFQPVDRRATNVRAKITELESICEGLGVPQVLALRRITLADPKFKDHNRKADLDDFFTIRLLALIEDYSYEKLEEMAPNGFAPILPPGDDTARAEDRALVQHLTRHLFG